MEINEFEKTYPNYNLGFLAKNQKTATEKLLNVSMHLVYARSHTYQGIETSEKRYEQIKNAILNTPKHIGVFMLNGKQVLLGYTKTDHICGVCIESKERIMTCLPLFPNGIVIGE